MNSPPFTLVLREMSARGYALVSVERAAVEGPEHRYHVTLRNPQGDLLRVPHTALAREPVVFDDVLYRLVTAALILDDVAAVEGDAADQQAEFLRLYEEREDVAEGLREYARLNDMVLRFRAWVEGDLLARLCTATMDYEPSGPLGDVPSGTEV